MVRSDTVSSRLEWCFLPASYFASRGVMKRAVAREFLGCSDPVLSAQNPWFPPGFFAFRANCFGFPAYPCMSMPAGAASSCALPWTLVSRPVSRQSRLRTLVFSGKTYGFVVEVQDSN